MTGENDEIERTPAEKNSWYKLMQESIELDDEKYPQGYHWLIAFHQLSIVTNLTKTLENLPEKHPLKSQPLPSDNIKANLKSIEKELKTLLSTVKKDRRIDFSELHFEKSIDFSNFIFPLYVSFEHTKFSGNVSFENAIFKSYSNFKESKFKRRASFQHAIFELHAPRFYGAKFNNEMTFAGMIPPKFEIAKADKLDKDGNTINDEKEIDKNYRKRIGENQNSYENTSTKLGNQKKYHDEHFFFRQEMYCRQKLEKKCLTFLSYWLYQTLSDYGYAMGRTFGFWAGHIFLGFIALLFISCQAKKPIETPFGCSLGISLSNSHAFFFKGDRLKDCYVAFEKLPWFNIVWGLQTIFGVTLLFLFLLTLRVRFRLK